MKKKLKWNKDSQYGFWHRALASVLLVVMIFAAIPNVALAGSNELIANGQFTAGENFLDGWTVSGDVSVSQDTFINHAMLNGTEGMAAIQSNTALAETEEYYKLSFDVKLTSNAIFTAKVLQNNEGAQSEAGDVNVPLPEDSHSEKWETVEYTFRTAADVTALAASFDAVVGTAYVRDVSLVCLYRNVKYNTSGTKVSIKNSSFSNGLENWVSVDGKAKTVEGYHGKAASVQAKDGIGRLVQENIVLESNSVYELHYYIKAEDAVGFESGAFIEVIDNGMLRQIDSCYLSGNSVAGGWQEMTAQFETNEISGKATIKLTVESTDETAVKGTVAFDELCLTKLEYQTFSTARAITPFSSKTATNNLFGFDNIRWADKNYTCAKDSVDATHGDVYKITCVTAGNRFMYHDIEWKEGKTYTISYWIKIDTALNSEVRIMPTVFLNGTQYKQDGDTTGQFKNTKITGAKTDWKQISFQYTPAASATTGSTNAFSLLLQFMQPGESLYLADVQIIPPEEEVSGVKNIFDFSDIRWADKNYTCEKDSVDATHGDVYKISCVTAGNRFMYYDVAWEAGKTYTISYWVKIDTAMNSEARIMPVVFLNGTQYKQDGDTTGQFKNTKITGAKTDWKQITFQYTPTASATTGSTNAFSLLFQFMQPGEALYIADVQIVLPAEKPNPSETEWLYNGNFAKGKEAWNDIADSDIVDGTAAGAKSGKALQITKEAGKNVTVTHNPTGKVTESGKKYTFEFRVRNDKLINDESSIGSVYFVDKSNNKIQATETKLIPTNGVWSEYIIDFTTDKAYEGLQLCLNMTGSEAITYTFADFKLEEYVDIVSNGDFEAGLNDWSTRWTEQWEEAGEVKSKENKEKPSGTNSTVEVSDDATYGKVLKAHMAKDDKVTYTDTYMTLNKSLVVGQTYKISLKLKNNQPINTDNVALAVLYIRDSRESGALKMLEVQGLGNQWKEYTLDYTPTEGYDNPKIHIRTFGNRTAAEGGFTDYYVADVKIERTDKTTTTLLKNGDFSSAIGAYPEYWGVIRDTAKVENGVAVVSKKQNENAGITSLSSVYEGANHTLCFSLKADAAAREALKIRLTPYADQTRTMLSGVAQIHPALNLKDTDDWQKVEVPFDVLAGISSMDISFLAEGTNAAQFSIDNVTVVLDEVSSLNFDFEIGSDVPVSWSGTGGTFTKVKESYDGSYAAKMTNVSGGSLTSKQFDLEPDADYELSYWIKADQTFDSYIFPVINQTKADGTTPAYSVAYTNKAETNYRQETSTLNMYWAYWTGGNTVTIENPEGWQQVRVPFHTSDEAGRGTLAIHMRGSAEAVWIDHVKITKKVNTANFDFEKVDEEGNPEGWYMTGFKDSNPQIQVDETVYHSGKRSLYLNTDTMVRDQQIVSSYQIPITVTDTTRIFEMSYWVASRNVDVKNIRMDMWYYGEDGVKLYNSSVSIMTPSLEGVTKPISAGQERTDWEQVIARVRVPEEAKYVGLIFTASNGEAEIWIDDIYFGQVENDAEVLAAHNDFHAVDQDGNIAEWDVVDADLNVITGELKQYNDDSEGGYGRMATTGNHYMRYRTNILGTNYKYTLAIRYKSDTNVDMQLRFNQYQDQEYEEHRITETLPATLGWTERTIDFTAPSATTCDMMFGLLNGGELEISQLLIYQTGAPETKMTWLGKWISYKNDFRWCKEYAHSYYRKEIQLTDDVEYAPLQFTADDKVTLYVNGKKIYSNEDDDAATWASVNTIYLEDYLKKGKNVIAFDAYNQAAYSAMIFDGIWTLKNGEKVYCNSDAGTVCYSDEYGQVASNWYAVNYDDSAWHYSIAVGGVPMNPWGNIYYDSSLYIDNSIEVKVTEGEGTLVNDLVYEFAVDIKLKEKIATQVPMTMVIWRKNSTKSLCKVTATLLTNTDMREWPVGKWVNVKMRVELPDYIEDGNYTLQLLDTYFAIDSEDIYDNKFINFKVVNDYVATELVTKVENINGVPTFTVNGEPTSTFFFLTPFTNVDSCLDTIANSGVETYINFDTAIGKIGNVDGLWQENGTVDYESFDSKINTILAASMDANLIVTINVHAPQWWLEENPDERAVASDINGTIAYEAGWTASFGSEKWKVQGGEILSEIIEHMRQQTYYARIAGIRITGGKTHEFITYGAQSTDTVPDYSPAAQAYFRKWAKEEYGTVENLREVWNDPSIESFETIQVPTFKELKADGGHGMLYNPETQQKLIDFRLLLTEMAVDSLLYWAKAAKEATDNKLVVGTYYGYLNTTSYWSNCGMTHTIIDELLSSPYLDFIASPSAYNVRQLGEAGYTQTVADSVRAYGKLCIAEQDNRTCLVNQFAGNAWDLSRDLIVGNTHTMEETLYQEKRDMVYNFVNGTGQWIMDMYGGWLNDDQIYEWTRDANEEYNFANYVERDLINDIALIMPDTNSAYYRTSQSADGDDVLSSQVTLAQYMYTWHRKQLDKIGAGYDSYALSTLVEGKMPQHKINVFFTPYMLTQEERDAIDTYCKKDGQINIFLYMSGYGDEDGFSLDNMTELTGFTYELNPVRSSGEVVITNDLSEITEDLKGQDFGSQISTSKYYLSEICVKDTADIVKLGELNDTGNIGFASKDMGDWTSIYCAAPYLTNDIYRNLLEMVDSHIYSDDKSNIVWSNNAYVGVHSSAAGKKKITLDNNYAVYDVFEEKYVSLNTNVIEYYNKANDTHLFRLTQADTYSFLVRIKGGHGEASVTGLEQVKPGTSRTIKITPDKGYMIRSVTVNGETVKVSDSNKLTFNDIDENKIVVVKFKRVPVDRVLEEDERNEEQPHDNNVSGIDTDIADSTVEPSEEETEQDGQTIMDDYEEIWETVLGIIHIPTVLVCGSLLAVVALVAIVLWFIRKKKEKEKVVGI